MSTSHLSNAQAFVLESKAGYKVVISNEPYTNLHPDNFVIIADGLRPTDAARLCIDADHKLNHREYVVHKYA